MKKNIKTVLPKKIPEKKDFFIKLLDAIFPELAQKGDSVKPGEYKSALRRCIKELEVADRYSTNESFTDFLDFSHNDGDLYSVIYEVNELDKRLYKHDNFDENHGGFDKRMVDYVNTIFNLMDSSAKTMNSLIGGDSQKLYKKFETSSFLTWILLKRKECAKTAGELLQYCLDALGVKNSLKAMKINTEISFSDTSFGEIVNEENGIKIRSVTDKGARLLIYSVFVTCSLLGHYPESGKDIIQEYYKIITEVISDNLEVFEAMETAREKLMEQLTTFKPRSIPKPGEYFLEDFYVLPVFEKNGVKCDPPLWDHKMAEKSIRSILTGKTGFGKTMYIRMLAKRIAEKRDDVTVVFITAEDFTACYHNSGYKDMTADLTMMYFTKMMSGADSEGERSDYNFSDKHRAYLMQQAKAGKLVLLLDSYDELPHGEVREAFMQAIRSFCEEYCSFFENDGVGANVLIASRQMTPKSMQEISCILLPEEEDPKDHIYTIKGLDESGKNRLIKNWQKYGGQEYLNDDVFSFIKNNHFFSTASESPFTLSLICVLFGSSFGTIVGTFINWSENKLKVRIKDVSDPFVRSTLFHGFEILEFLALKSLKENRADFDDHFIDNVIEQYIKIIPDGENHFRKIGQMREILLMQSGVLVPVEEKEDIYRFTDENLKYELAAKKIVQMIFEDHGYDRFRSEVLEQLSVYDSVNVLVRVICSFGLSYCDIVRRLTCDMLTIMTETIEEERILITGLEDLFLNRYKVNHISAANLSPKDRSKIEPAQRLVLMRILCSPEFNPRKTEREAYKKSDVYHKLISTMIKEIGKI